MWVRFHSGGFILENLRSISALGSPHADRTGGAELDPIIAVSETRMRNRIAHNGRRHLSFSEVTAMVGAARLLVAKQMLNMVGCLMVRGN